MLVRFGLVPSSLVPGAPVSQRHFESGFLIMLKVMLEVRVPTVTPLVHQELGAVHAGDFPLRA